MSPLHTVTQVLPSFPDMTSKELRGSLEVLACWLPVPCGQCPRLLPSSRPHPRAGLPASLAPGPPAIIPAPLQRTSCVWVNPHQPGQHVLSVLLPSNSTRGTSRFLLQGSLQHPLWVSESSLGVASTVPSRLVSSSLPAGGGCVPTCRAAPRGFEEPLLLSPLPSLPSPMPAPACLSLGSRPCPPWGYSSVPCAPSQPWNGGCPTALPCSPSLSTGTRLVTLPCSWLSMPSVCPRPQVHPELSESSPGCRPEHSAALLTCSLGHPMGSSTSTGLRPGS